MAPARSIAAKGPSAHPTRPPQAAGVSRRPDLLASLLLVALCLSFFWPVFLGRVLVPADGVYAIDELYKPHRPAGWALTNAALTPDQIYMLYVWREYSAHSMATGRVPLWSPYAGCGVPLLANDQSAVLQPVSFALNLLLAPGRAQTVYALLCLLAACLFTYGLVRALGGGPTGGVLAGLSFGFGGFVFTWLGYPLAATAVWLPALLWVTHWLVRRPSALGAAALAGVIGIQFLSGHLSTSAQMLVFWLVFLGWDVARARREQPPGWALRLGLVVTLGLALGLGLGAPQVLPTRESYAESAIARQGGRNTRYAATVGEAVRKSLLGDGWFLRGPARGDLSLLFVPERHGNPAFGDYRQFPGYGGYPERASYIGLVGLLFLVAGLVWWPPPGPRRFFLLSALLAFGVLLHLPILNGLTYLPILNQASPARLRFVFALCAAVALGLTVSDWLTAPRETLSRRCFWHLALALALVSGALAVTVLPLLAPHFAELSRRTLALRLLKLFAPALAALALLVLLRWESRLPRAAVAAALVVISVLDLFTFGARWHPLTRPDTLLPTLPEVAQLRAATGLSRLTAPANLLAPNLATHYGLYDTRVYDPIVPERTVALAQILAGQPRTADTALVKGQPSPPPLLNRLTSVVGAYHWDHVLGWRFLPSPDALPRAYLATGLRPVTEEGAEQALAAGFDPARTTLLEGGQAAPQADDGVVTSAQIVSYSPHRVEIRADATRPTWLILTDTAYPGWTATVNGHPTPWAIANLAFRAVPVPTGASAVVFEYAPASYRLGLFLGLLALACTLGLATAHVTATPRPRPS